MTTEEVVDGLIDMRNTYEDPESKAVFDELIKARLNGVEGQEFLALMKVARKELRKISRGNLKQRFARSLKEMFTDPVFLFQQAAVIIYVTIKELL